MSADTLACHCFRFDSHLHQNDKILRYLEQFRDCLKMHIQIVSLEPSWWFLCIRQTMVLSPKYPYNKNLRRSAELALEDVLAGVGL